MHVILLFHASSQTLGLSREHERDDGEAPEVQGPATNIPYGQGGPLKPSVCRPSNISTTASVLVPTHLWRTSSLYVLIFGRKESSQPTAMDRYNTENGRNQRELFQWLLPRTTELVPLSGEWGFPWFLFCFLMFSTQFLALCCDTDWNSLLAAGLFTRRARKTSDLACCFPPVHCLGLHFVK